MPSQIFPELTPSEIEICRLVILGKGLKEVCRELSKVESNITSQRRHIRIKLGLQPSDNLKKSFWQDSTK
jgi:transcriptional regulator